MRIYTRNELLGSVDWNHLLRLTDFMADVCEAYR